MIMAVVEGSGTTSRFNCRLVGVQTNSGKLRIKAQVIEDHIAHISRAMTAKKRDQGDWAITLGEDQIGTINGDFCTNLSEVECRADRGREIHVIESIIRAELKDNFAGCADSAMA